ncbi:39S ribosomal protein L18, mitochondrial [Pseudolycoriella hygida]|uniref:Large ribosomal subunit protein uL18m n=1 Tax=Pseudolycoriella hygida TaxID=35572 RepID=A0A9Q0RWT9_9DIPT|nr:39S ribosomal protein L18, mitochondrial [Pseudolycoriella hygida]
MPAPRAPRPSRILTKVKELTQMEEGVKYMTNRNPRNLERLRIAYKPKGYHLEEPGRNFWHKLELTTNSQTVTAQIVHFRNGPVLQASTNEWPIRKHLYKTNDTSAYVNLARVFAQRCLESGLTEMLCKIKATPNGKVEKFLKTLEDEGVRLQEADQYEPDRPWNLFRPEKPWEVTE